jgi:hypothetical protein
MMDAITAQLRRTSVSDKKPPSERSEPPPDEQGRDHAPHDEQGREQTLTRREALVKTGKFSLAVLAIVCGEGAIQGCSGVRDHTRFCYTNYMDCTPATEGEACYNDYSNCYSDYSDIYSDYSDYSDSSGSYSNGYFEYYSNIYSNYSNYYSNYGNYGNYNNGGW